MTIENNQVSIKQLRKGVYIELTGSWTDHPFFFSKFIITSDKQIKTLREYGIHKVRFISEKSEVLPYTEAELAEMKENSSAHEAEQETETSTQEPESNPKAIDNILTAEELEKTKEERKEQQILRNREIQRCEKRFKKTVSTVKNVMKTLMSRPVEAINQATDMIDDTVESLLTETDVVVNVMNEKGLDENAYFHTMNVSLLSLLLGKSYGLGRDEMKTLGMGALFHDMGKVRVPDPILYKQTPLTKVEFKAYAQHPYYGAELARKIETFPQESVSIIEQHHEKLNGKGYPKQLKGEQISLLSRITAIANIYDNHCNHGDINRDLTPHEALSFMYTRQKEEIDQDLLKIFVHCLGVYPPGSIVQLSNDCYAMVISVNSKRLLHPKVILYNEDIPRQEAIIFDMEDDESVTIKSSIRPAKLPTEVYQYLSPRKHIQYSYDSPEAENK